MSKRDFRTLSDVSVTEWSTLLARAAELKAARATRTSGSEALAGRSVALVFEKPSTRTRVSFEVGVRELGGNAVVLSSSGSQIERGEPVADTARVLSGYCDAIVLRTFGQARLVEMCEAATVPVLNGLTDEHHPCQIASDLLTVREEFGRIEGLRYAWIGDGNNMANSWIEAAGLFGLDLGLACPVGYRPDAANLAVARERQRVLGRGRIEITDDPREAAGGADVVSTDVWASMGQEAEAVARRAAFDGYCVDAAVMHGAQRQAIVLHCLPAHRGEEISEGVLEGPQSRVWRQAENRLHMQKALLELVVARRATT